MESLPIFFLVSSLFIPRISLLFLWAWNLVPLNPTPFVADVLMSIFVPRVLVLILIAVTLGFTGWFWLHLIIGILSYSGGVTLKFRSE